MTMKHSKVVGRMSLGKMERAITIQSITFTVWYNNGFQFPGSYVEGILQVSLEVQDRENSDRETLQ